MHVITKDSLDQLIELLRDDGFETIGPTLDGGAIVYDRIESLKDLPVGLGEEQEAGTYRLKKRGDQALFGYALGPTSWKKFLFPPSVKLWQAERSQKGFRIEPEQTRKHKMAFLGVRPCELHAIGIQDKVFLKGQHMDPHYQCRREDVLIIAVNCTRPGGTCFCVSMATGPKAAAGFDLSLTEVLESGSHYFVVETATPRGEEILRKIPHESAGESQVKTADGLLDEAKGKMGRQMDTEGIRELLYQNAEHPQWEKIAQACLSCANCTLVCPTCFCSSVEDVTDVTGDHAQRWRRWDSCFNLEFSYIHGGQVRSSTKSRYRQWMTHKLAGWQDQFGTSGCVGCGRCITWCPVGIDITEELKNIRVQEKLGG